MNPLTAMIQAGAVKSVRGFAIEAVRGLAPGVPTSPKSALSRAVKSIRREFNLPSTAAGYELARNVFRRAMSEVRRADRETERQFRLIERGIDPGSRPPRGADYGRKATYTVYVELTSTRSNRTYRGQVNVEAYYGTPGSVIAEAARRAVIAREVPSQAVRGSRNYGNVPLQTWQVANYTINGISFEE